VYAAHRNSRPWSFDKKESVIDAPEYDPDVIYVRVIRE
jgi:hypothetical protein